MPKIESALVLLERKDRLGDAAHVFGRFIATAFSSRRKTLRNSLNKAGVDAEKVLAAAGIDLQLRPEDLTPDQWLEVFQRVRNCGI
jgi:16S rRNA A1518/A1519 N6-dimethyltransferase RsmA/KsgA/DIM1 with predicted DNA glycosylase/AP lyase activity